MANYKSLQVADALARVSQELRPKVSYGSLENSVYGQNTNTPNATIPDIQRLAEAQQYYDSIQGKSGSDYTQDALVALGKGVVGVPQALAGIVDVVDTGLSAANVALQGGNPLDVQGGRFTKALADVGVDFKTTQDFLGGLYSDATLQQQQGLANIPGTSTEKSLADNLSSIGQTAGYVWDNPSLALNAIAESVPSIVAGGAIGRGAQALGAGRAAGAIGEGAIMAGQAQANMDKDAEGYTTASQALGALGIGVLGAGVGYAGQRFAANRGASDIDAIAAGVNNPSASQGIRSLGIGTLTEAAEEATQSSLENVISNISSGKDAIGGLNQDLVLGTIAGGAMGAGTNAPSALSQAALDAVTNVAQRQASKIQERMHREAPETSDIATEVFSDPTSSEYNPTAAIIREAGKITADSTPEEVSAIKQSVDQTMNGAEDHLSSLQEVKKTLSNIAVLEQNIQAGQEAVTRFSETDPERAQQIQGIVDNLKAQHETASAYVGKETELDSAIEHASNLVTEARTMHERYSTMLGQAESQLNTTPEAQVFGAPTAYSVDQLNTMLNDASIPDTSKVALRALSEAMVAQNAVKDLDAVNQQVVGKSLDANYISTPQYLEQFGSAIKRGSVNAQRNLLTQIEAFENSHVAKAKLADSALKLANRIGRSVQIINADGEWVVNTGKPLKGSAKSENGALDIHPVKAGKKGSTDLVNYMNTEAKAVTATRTAMEAMYENQNGPINTYTPETTEFETSNVATQDSTQLSEAPTQPTTTQPSIEDALDSYNQDMRDSNEWEPNRRAVDPRSTEVRPSVAEVTPTAAATQTEVQPTRTRNAEAVDTKQPSNQSEVVQTESSDVVTEPTINIPTTEAVVESDFDSAEAPNKEVNDARKEERTKEPNKRNLVVDGFNKKDSVLNLNDDFVSNHMNREDNTDTIKTLTGLDNITPKQQQVVKDFVGFANNMNPKIQKLVLERKGKTAKGNDYADFRYQDFNQFLLVDGQLPENVATAVSASIFTWLGENGSKTIDGESDVVSKMLLSDVEVLPTHVFDKLSTIGTHQNTIAASIGQKAYKALGYKITKDVDPMRQSKIEMGLGTMAIVAMVQQGYLERNVISNQEMNALIKDTMNVNEEASSEDMDYFLDAHQFAFVKPVTDVNNKPVKKVDMIIESNKQTGSIIGKLFDIPMDNKYPSTEASTKTPNTFNRMDSAIPEFAKEVYEKSQKNGYKMSATAMKFIDTVSNEDLKELFGFVKQNEDGSFDGMHKKFWKGQEAANQALERSLDIIAEQRNNLGDDSKEFFFEHTIWTNQRSGYDSVFNLQANKVHRAVAGMSDHITEIGVSEATHNADGTTTKYGEFLQAVAMLSEEVADIIGLPTVDKVSSKTYLPKFQEYLERDYVKAGIESMASVIETKPTKADIDNIKRVVAEFGMGPMSVRALQALAQQYIAERDGQKTFTADIAFESDGVTNGPVITNVALNTADPDMLEAGGVFTDKAKTNVPTNKETGKEDIYEQLGNVMKNAWSNAKKDPSTKPRALKSMNALDVIYPAFGARKGAKPITTTSNYGAGNASIIRANGREVLNSFYKSLEKAGKKGDTAKAQDLINAVNDVLDYHNSFLGKVSKAIASGDPLMFELTQEQETALLKVSSIQHGKAIKETLDTAMGEFQKVRDTLTTQAVTGFKVYDIIRTKAMEEALKNTTDVVVDGKGNRQEGLTAEQQKAVLKSIVKYTPSVVSGMGGRSANSKQSSIPLMKQAAVWDSSSMAKQQFNFVGKFEKGGSNQGKFSVTTGIRRNSVADPGVSGLALIIQSLDAFIAHSTLGAMPVQNFHDANASRVGNGKAMAKIQNEAFVDGLISTHVNREFTRALLSPLQKIVDDSKFYTENKTAVDEAVADLGLLTDLVTNAYQRDLAKLNGMKSWENINQYGTEGGHFVMTDAKRKEIVDAVDKLMKDYKKDLAIATKIQDTLKSDSKPTTLQEHLERDVTMKGSDVVPMLQAELKQFQSKDGNAGKFSQFYDAMLDLITDRMPASLEVNYFSELEAPTNVSGLQEAVVSNNPAWFTTGKDGNPQINILKSNEPIKAQILVHELVHAITVDSISQVRKDPVAHANAKESLDKIDALYDFIKAEVANDPNATDLMKYATKNVEEFIATGFSYPEFVDYLDSKLAPKAVRSKNRIITALRSFVENILGVLENFTGRKYSAKDATALEALILDSTEFLGRTNPQVVGTQTSIFGAPQQARDKVAGYTSKQVFHALDSNIDTGFKKHLVDMMVHVSDTIYEGLDQSLIENPDGTWSMERAWEAYIDSGKAMTTETATTAGFRMTEQESFAVESLYAALSHGMKDKSMTQTYAEMNKAFASSKSKLSPKDFHNGDWNTASSSDRCDAQDMYDFIFKRGPSNPDPLARFVSMALGSQQFNEMLGFTVRDTDSAPTGLFEKMVNGTNDILDYVGGLMTNSSSAQLVNSKLGLLARELARIDSKNRGFAVSKVEAQIEKLADMTDGISNSLRDKVVAIADKDNIANSRFTAVRLASNVTRLSAKGDLWTTLDVIKDGITHDKPNEKLGFLGELINEAANNDDTKTGVEKLLRLTKLNNQVKEQLRDTTTKNVLSTFEENGSYLTKDHKTAISNMLRSDVQSLSGTYSTKEIARMYSDKAFLHRETVNLEKQLGDQVMINRAKQLAKYMVTGLSSQGLAKNAQLIVSGFNSSEVVPLTDPRVELVDKIASMYAIQYTSTKEKTLLGEVMARELKNSTNGIDTSIKFHKELSKVARDTLFTNNPTSMIKGFVPEITNPNREVRIAHNEAEAKLFRDQFYKEVKTLDKDKLDPSTTVNKLYMTEEANLQRLVSGAIEVVSTNRKGTSVPLDKKAQANLANTIKNSIPTSAGYNPMKDTNVYMVPNYDTKGSVIGFSYEMSGKHRDTMLERNNDFAELLGAYAATNYNKATVPQQNNLVVDAAFEDYKENFVRNPRAYVTVGPNSSDVGLREIWAMLPEDTRKHATKVWGKDGMQVRNDVLLSMFGYRKYSLNQAFDKMDEAKSTFEKIYTGIMSEIFGNNAKIRGVQGERAWQEAVGLMKDIIVIRNVKTLLFNTVSNTLLLMSHGISPTDLVKDTMLSIRAGMQYRKDVSQLMAAQQKQRAGVGDFDKLEQEILRLEESIGRNPLKGFIEEGMMPTIVEDVDPDTNHYSYKSKMQEKVEGITSSVPKSVKTAAKWAFVSPDTPLYKFLNNATQFSDFSSKYVMYRYYTQKAKDKLSHDEALQIASDNFINYDVPTSKGLQYMNDMGIVMFTKYNVRIQKALFQLLKKRPATAMAQALFINSFTNFDSGLDPLIWFNMGVPFRDGAFGLPSALDEPLPIKMMQGAF